MTRILLNIGYIGLWDSTARRYRLEHRVKMEDLIGRPLTSSEVVHHIDGDRTNNDLRNLQLMTRGEHNREHGTFARLNRVHPINESGTHRWCARCQSTVPLENWARSQNYCRPCRRNQQREWYQKNLKHARAKHRVYTARRRAKLRAQTMSL